VKERALALHEQYPQEIPPRHTHSWADKSDSTDASSLLRALRSRSPSLARVQWVVSLWPLASNNSDPQNWKHTLKRSPSLVATTSGLKLVLVTSLYGLSPTLSVRWAQSFSLSLSPMLSGQR